MEILTSLLHTISEAVEFSLHVSWQLFAVLNAPPVIVYGRRWFSPDKITDCPRFCTDFPPIFAHGGCLCTINSLSDRLLTQGWPNSHISFSSLSVLGVLHQNTTVNPKKCYLLTQKLSVEAIIVAQNLTMCHFLISASPMICYLCFTSEILIAEVFIYNFTFAKTLTRTSGARNVRISTDRLIGCTE